jgi:hypothetical protein
LTRSTPCSTGCARPIAAEKGRDGAAAALIVRLAALIVRLAALIVRLAALIVYQAQSKK